VDPRNRLIELVPDVVVMTAAQSRRTIFRERCMRLAART
jgi:hypothetical protein